MFIRKNVQGIILVKGGDGAFDPPAGQSSRWMQWVTEQDLRVCAACQSMQGRVYSLYEEPDPAPPLHPN